MTQALEDLLMAFPAETASVAARLGWIEALVLAAEGAGLEGDGARAALDLKAALGAVVEFSRGPQREAEQAAMSITVKALLTRGLQSLFGALSRTYLELAKEGHSEADCRELARLLSTVERSVARAEPVAPNVVKRFHALRARIAGDD